MQWKKTPPELAAKFDRAAPKDPKVVRKPMFGYPALYLNGNMFAGTFQDKIVARLSEKERERAIKAGAKRFEPMPGRPMKEYVVVPAADVAKPAALAKWIEQARAYATTLPEKTKAAKNTTQKAIGRWHIGSNPCAARAGPKGSPGVEYDGSCESPRKSSQSQLMS